MKRILSWRALGVFALWAACASFAWAGSVQPTHSFDGMDGRVPTSPLLLASDGNWYGTTSLGGANHQGTVYRVAPDGSFSVLHAFNVQGGGKDEFQVSELTEGPDHHLYGSIGPGSQRHGGILFRVSPAGEFTALHEFGDFQTRGGRLPAGPPVPGPDGNFYGATRAGGEHGLGTVYRMTPQGDVTLIHSFEGFPSGWSPDSTVVVSPAGEIFGTTVWGPGGGLGMVYRMGLSGENYTAFHAWPTSRKEGVFPSGLVRAPNGDLYGTTIGLDSGPNGNYQGLIFKLTPDGSFSIVRGFRDGGRAGIQPNGFLTLDSSGALYGATYSGGSYNAGTVFRIEPDGHLSVLADLGGKRSSPRRPSGGASPAPDGSVWFTTRGGGEDHHGEWGTLVHLPAP